MSPSSAPLDAGVVARVRASFARQGMMETLGAELANVSAGRVAISLAIEPRLCQQHGFLHAVERRQTRRRRRSCPRAGRTLTVCRGDAYAEHEAERTNVATMLATMVRRRAE